MLKGTLVLASLLIPLHLSAGILVNNFGAGFPNSSPGTTSTSATFIATNFTTISAGNLSSVVSGFCGSPASVTAGLYTDSGGLPGSLLESWNVLQPACPNGFHAGLTTLSSVLSPAISSGTQYWFLFTQTAQAQVTWYENDLGILGGVWSGNTLNGLLHVGSDFPTPGIRLTTGPEPPSTLPEPTTGMLIAVGISLLFVRRRFQEVSKER